ncbi:hypothetical protein [Clostridium botulinum]|nr:hypothetical protein [Clostridium botulinum]
MLAELEYGVANKDIENMLVYYDVLGEDIDEEYWKRIEKWC